MTFVCFTGPSGTLKGGTHGVKCAAGVLWELPPYVRKYLREVQTTRLVEESVATPLPSSWRLTRIEKTRAAIQTATIRM